MIVLDNNPVIFALFAWETPGGWWWHPRYPQWNPMETNSWGFAKVNSLNREKEALEQSVAQVQRWSNTWWLTHPLETNIFDVDKPWKSTIKWSGMPHCFLNRPMILLVDLFSFWEADKEKDDLIENFLYTKVFEGVWGGWDYVFWSRLFPSTVDHRIMAVVWQLFFHAPGFLGEVDFVVNQESTKSTSSCMVPRSFLLLMNQSGLRNCKCLFIMLIVTAGIS